MLIDIGEIRLNYAEWGTGEDTVVFIHGNLACGMWFDLVGPLVADHFRVIAVDWRGCGASDKPVPLAADIYRPVGCSCGNGLSFQRRMAVVHWLDPFECARGP